MGNARTFSTNFNSLSSPPNFPPRSIRRNRAIPSEDDPSTFEEMSPSTTFTVTPVPCLNDNYAYILHDKMNNVAALVDPVQPSKVLKALEALGILPSQVSMILTTHRHNDHAGGNEELASLLPHAEVYGGKIDECAAVTVPLRGNETISLGSTSLRCIPTPCHTRGHICYLATGLHKNEAPALFSGDTLFIGGCGRLFEGTPQMMYHNLTGTLAALDDNTRVYSGHEYTISNLQFGAEAAEERAAAGQATALAKSTDNIRAKLTKIQAEKEQFDEALKAKHGDLRSFEYARGVGVDEGFGRYCTQGSTIAEERKTNVFMMASSAEEFAELRSEKDSWKGPKNKLCR